MLYIRDQHLVSRDFLNTLNTPLGTTIWNEIMARQSRNGSRQISKAIQKAAQKGQFDKNETDVKPVKQDDEPKAPTFDSKSLREELKFLRAKDKADRKSKELQIGRKVNRVTGRGHKRLTHAEQKAFEYKAKIHRAEVSMDGHARDERSVINKPPTGTEVVQREFWKRKVPDHKAPRPGAGIKPLHGNHVSVARGGLRKTRDSSHDRAEEREIEAE